MINLKKYFMNRSLEAKLTICFFMVISILIFMITYFDNLSYKQFSNISQRKNTYQIVKQINNNIDFYVEKTENIINYMSTDPVIIKFFNDNKTEEYSVDDEIYKSIYRFTKFNKEIAGIMIINRNGGYISDVMNKVSSDSLVNEKWYIESIEEPDKIHLYTKPIGRNIDNIFKYPADEVFSVSKAIVDEKSNKIIGVVLIDVKLDIIKSIIENAKPGTAGFVYIVDKNGQIVYTPINKVVYRIKNEWLEEMNEKIIKKNINGENYVLAKINSDYTGWEAVSVFPESESMKVIRCVEYISFTIGIIMLFFSGSVAALLTRTIVKPLYKLKDLMKDAQSGNLDVHFNTKYNDEIGELGRAFNIMVKEIQKLLILIKVQEKKKRKAEMNVLQAQIKPHFMYNTLDTIRWMADEKEDYGVSEIIQRFTDLLRISLSKGKEIITIQEELNHVEDYLSIQKIRYEDKLNYKIDFDKVILKYKVVKLIIQPIVENAIYHGIKEKRGSGKIEITGKVKNNIIEFIVKDNGKGIEKEKLKQINYMLTSDKHNNNEFGYGIYNVNERIKLMYGNEYGVRISSVYEEGTEVEIIHPIRL